MATRKAVKIGGLEVVFTDYGCPRCDVNTCLVSGLLDRSIEVTTVRVGIQEVVTYLSDRDLSGPRHPIHDRLGHAAIGKYEDDSLRAWIERAKLNLAG